MTRLQELHTSIANWFVQRGGKLDVIKNSDFDLTEIKTKSWTVFIGPDTWSVESFATQTESLEVAILIDATIDESKYAEGEFRSLVDEMQNQIHDDAVTLMPNFPDLNELWLARSIFVDELEPETLNPILDHLTVWADAAYAKFATWPNAPRIKLINQV